MHVNNPNLALDKAWERLRESYAAPKVIEKSMFQRFPKILAKDHLKLRKLGDLLAEIQDAKEDGYLTGLSYLDNSRSIGPIVDKKRPYGLQEKWVSAGSRYKEGNDGRFPPFKYFCNFVTYEAKSATTLASFIKAAPQHSPNLANHFHGTLTPTNPSQCTKLIFPQPTTTLTRTARYITSPIPLKGVEPSGTNPLMIERASSERKEHVSSAAPPSPTLPKTAGPL